MVYLWYIQKTFYGKAMFIGLTNTRTNIVSLKHITSYDGYRMPVPQAALKFR